MKVYVVFEHLFDEHFGSSTDYCGVFSTRENAESWIKRNEYYGSHFEIKEDSLDERKLYNIFEYRGTPSDPTIIYRGGFDSKEEAAAWINQNNSIGSWYEIK